MNNKIINSEVIVNACSGNLLCGDKLLKIDSFENDSRNIHEGHFYVAIKGESFDGNDYIEDAFNKGAIGCLTDKNFPTSFIEKYNNKVIIKVKNTIKAIQDLARYKRQQYDIPVIAVTGSVGKTSTKDIIAKVLSSKYNVLKTEGNFNNHIGLPLTLLKLDTHDAVVVEMGMNHFGEISLLTSIAKPTIAVITNIGTAHIGILGSKENILKAKLEILEGLPKNGLLIINNDDVLLHKLTNTLSDYNIVSYGIENPSDFYAYNINENSTFSSFDTKIDNKKYTVNVPVSGKHFVYNSLCAISIAHSLRISTDAIVNNIKDFVLSPNRMEMHKFNNNITVIDDSYNANFDSMKAAVEVLSNSAGNRKIAVLGDMLELGDFSEELHKKVGKIVSESNVNILIAIGNFSKSMSEIAKENNNISVFWCATLDEGVKVLKSLLQEGDTVLLKASHSMHFDNILNMI